MEAHLMATLLRSADESRPANINAEEWAHRVQLAACYRIFDHLGWVEMIYNHITLRVPGPEKHFLINPFGLMYREVTASNLVKIDVDGNVVGSSNYPVNPAGFIIHSAIHEALPDAHCVMHTHTTAGMAVASSKEGVTVTNFYGALVAKQLAYHDFEGITTEPGEKERLVASMGTKPYVVLRNHGLLVHGRDVAEAFVRMWQLQRACEVQIASRALGEVITLSDEVCERSHQASMKFNPRVGWGWDVFAAMQRLMDQKDPSYRT
jgi:ribulose-5-phosphate 4-epimerase/fuculose-1-phosphate aldolase